MNYKRFYCPDRMQVMMLPPCIDDWVPEDHPARFIAEIVDQLDLTGFYNKYGDRGARAYDPGMLLALLIYNYSTGVFSSRKIEKATYETVPSRFLTGNMHPDHDTIANFRKKFLPEIQECFKQVIVLAREMGLVQMGNIYIDGTKVKANASKHKAMSHKYLVALEAKLEQEIKQLLEMAKAADEQTKEIDIPEELKRREDRLASLKAAKKILKERAQERDEAKEAEYQEKLRVWKEKEKNKQRRGRKPEPPKDKGPQDKDQISFTDSESRIMKTCDGFQQCFNAQAAVTEDMLIVGQIVNNHGNDKGELLPTLDSIPKELGQIENVIADNGYLTVEGVEGCNERDVKAYVSLGREATASASPLEKQEESKERPRFKEMQERLLTEEGKELYRRRKFKVEPVFGIIKEVVGFRRFSLRGEANVQKEWGLVCLAYNVKMMFGMVKRGKMADSTHKRLENDIYKRKALAFVFIVEKLIYVSMVNINMRVIQSLLIPILVAFSHRRCHLSH